MSYTPNQEKIKISSTGLIYASAFEFLGYNAVVGTQEGATHSTITAAITAVPSGGKILILSGTFVETISFAKQLTIEGDRKSTRLNSSH